MVIGPIPPLEGRDVDEKLGDELHHQHSSVLGFILKLWMSKYITICNYSLKCILPPTLTEKYCTVLTLSGLSSEINVGPGGWGPGQYSPPP